MQKRTIILNNYFKIIFEYDIEINKLRNYTSIKIKNKYDSKEAN